MLDVGSGGDSFNDYEVALLYYQTVRMLTELAEGSLSLVSSLLKEWEATEAPGVGHVVKRVEIVFDGALQPMYFHVPDVVRETKDTLQVRMLRTGMFNENVLLTPEQKVKALSLQPLSVPMNPKYR